MEVRKIVVVTDELFREGRRKAARPLHVSTAIAVIKNPFAGEAQEDLTLLATEYSADLGPRLAGLAVGRLEGGVESFGKAVLVGLRGETQHGSSIIHTRTFGDALRNAVGGRAPVTSTEKRGPAGATIDVSMRNVHDTGAMDGTDVSHLFNWPVSVADAPEPDEIMVIVTVADGGRILA